MSSKRGRVRSNMLPSSRPPSFLEILPGEIRNQIFMLCIEDAFHSPKAQRSRALSDIKDFQVSVLPRWSGPGCLRMNGIGPLPLIFANKLANRELSSLVYSMINEVSIGGYILQYRDEDPSLRWKCAYSLLEKRPNLQRFTRNLKICLPCAREDLDRGYWSALKYKPKCALTQSSTCQVWLVLPELKEFLATFQSLQSLILVITADKKDPPSFEELLPIYDLYRDKTTIVIREPLPPQDRLVWTDSWITTWKTAWNQCLVKNERV